jgi:hypothetical protein
MFSQIQPRSFSFLCPGPANSHRFPANGLVCGSSNLAYGVILMKTTNAWAWLTAGVLALGLNGIYQDGGAAWVHRQVNQAAAGIGDESEEVLALAAGRADWFMAKANSIAAREETASCRLAPAMARLQDSLAKAGQAHARMAQTKVARVQSGMARLEAMSARGEAQLARLEANRARMEAQFARTRSVAEFNPGICPRIRVRVPRVEVSVPEVHVRSVNFETDVE